MIGNATGDSAARGVCTSGVEACAGSDAEGRAIWGGTRLRAVGEALDVVADGGVEP